MWFERAKTSVVIRIGWIRSWKGCSHLWDKCEDRPKCWQCFCLLDLPSAQALSGDSRLDPHWFIIRWHASSLCSSGQCRKSTESVKSHRSSAEAKSCIVEQQWLRRKLAQLSTLLDSATNGSQDLYRFRDHWHATERSEHGTEDSVCRIRDTVPKRLK